MLAICQSSLHPAALHLPFSPTLPLPPRDPAINTLSTKQFLCSQSRESDIMIHYFSMNNGSTVRKIKLADLQAEKKQPGAVV